MHQNEPIQIMMHQNKSIRLSVLVFDSTVRYGTLMYNKDEEYLSIDFQKLRYHKVS